MDTKPRELRQKESKSPYGMALKHRIQKRPEYPAKDSLKTLVKRT